MMIRSPLIPINRWHWLLAKMKKNTHCFVFQKEKKSFSKPSILKSILGLSFSVVLKIFLTPFNWIFLTTLLEPKIIPFYEL